MSHVCLAGQLSWRGKNCNVGHYKQIFQPNFFHTCHAYRQLLASTSLYHFSRLWSWRMVTRQTQSRTSWLHFLLHFSTDQDEVLHGVEAVQA